MTKLWWVRRKTDLSATLRDDKSKALIPIPCSISHAVPMPHTQRRSTPSSHADCGAIAASLRSVRSSETELPPESLHLKQTSVARDRALHVDRGRPNQSTTQTPMPIQHLRSQHRRCQKSAAAVAGSSTENGFSE